MAGKVLVMFKCPQSRPFCSGLITGGRGYYLAICDKIFNLQGALPIIGRGELIRTTVYEDQNLGSSPLDDTPIEIWRGIVGIEPTTYGIFSPSLYHLSYIPRCRSQRTTGLEPVTSHIVTFYPSLLNPQDSRPH